MKNIKCIAFDCFGTVFDMSNFSRKEIVDYVKHVNKNNFSPFNFPESWFELKSHPDSSEGIIKLQNLGYRCVAMSNGSFDLIQKISHKNKIEWDYIIDLVKHGVYKPKKEAYFAVEKQTGFKPEETLMVTANPDFGDIEGSESIGMKSQVIRQNNYPKTIIELVELLKNA